MIIGLSLVLFVAEAGAQAGYCDCFGGIDAEGQFWSLLDHEGRPLEDGDWIYAAWTGPNGEIDPPGADGYPAGDDVLLPVGKGEVEHATFFISVASWASGTIDYEGNPRHPTTGDLIYCRLFDGPPDSLGPGNYYADSQTHEIVWKLGDVLYCQFPGDPGQGHTDTPLPLKPAQPDTTAADSSAAASCEE